MPVNHRYLTNTHNTYYYTIFYKNGAVVHGGPVDASTTLSYEDYLNVTSVGTPGFSGIKPWKLPLHPYRKEYKLYTASPADFQQRAVASDRTTIYQYTCNARFLGMESDISAWGSSVVESPTQRAISRLIDEVKRGKAQAAVAMAESYKTASHLAHTAQRLADALLALRRGNITHALEALGVTASKIRIKSFYTGLRKVGGKKNQTFRYDKRLPLAREQQESRYHDFLAKTWLEYSYGWKPLLKDVYDHAEALSSTLVETEFTMRVARGRVKVERKSLVKVISGQLAFLYDISSTKWMEYVVRYRLPPGAVNPMTAFGMTNPLLVAWELVPFSFVADWFLPIGQALENLTAYQDLVFQSGTVTERHYYTNHAVASGSGPFVSGGVTYAVDHCDVESTSNHLGITRAVLSSFPYFGWPKFKDPRSVTHAASALALLQSLFVHGGTGNLKLR